MLSACLACLTSSLWIERTGSNSFVIKGKNKANSKVFDFTKATYAKVKKENGDIVDVNEVPNLNCKFEFENHEHYIVGKYYLTNTADKRAKFDFSHGIEFNPSILDGELSASYYENYGVAIYFYLLPDYGDYVTMTWVSMSHPEVTDINLFHYNDKGDKIFFEGNSMYNEQWFYSSWFANSWIDLWIEPHQTIMKSFVIYDDFYDTPRFKLDTTLIKEEIASDEKIHLKGRFWHKVEGRDIKGRYEIINKKDGSIAQKLSLGEMKTTTSDYTVAFDIYTDPLPIGEYTIKVIASYITYDSIYDIDFKVYQGNVRLKVLLTKPDSKYYVPNSDVEFNAMVYDPDAQDKNLNVKIFLGDKKVYSQDNVVNNKDQKKFSFTVPVGTKPGVYVVKLVANDGKDDGYDKFEVVIQDDFDTMITFIRDESKNSYKRGEVINFTSEVLDKDIAIDKQFKVTAFYNDELKISMMYENTNGVIRIPMTITVPQNETRDSAHIVVKAEGRSTAEGSFSVNIEDAVKSDEANGKLPNKDKKKKTILISVLSVLAVLLVITAIIIFILLGRNKGDSKSGSYHHPSGDGGFSEENVNEN